MTDTLSIVERLMKAGIEERQAKAISHEIANGSDQVATHNDVANVETALRNEIDGVRREITNVEKTLRGEIDGVRRDIGGLKAWILGLVVPVVLALLAIMIPTAIRQFSGLF